MTLRLSEKVLHVMLNNSFDILIEINLNGEMHECDMPMTSDKLDIPKLKVLNRNDHASGPWAQHTPTG